MAIGYFPTRNNGFFKRNVIHIPKQNKAAVRIYAAGLKVANLNPPKTPSRTGLQWLQSV